MPKIRFPDAHGHSHPFLFINVRTSWFDKFCRRSRPVRQTNRHVLFFDFGCFFTRVAMLGNPEKKKTIITISNFRAFPVRSPLEKARIFENPFSSRPYTVSRQNLYGSNGLVWALMNELSELFYRIYIRVFGYIRYIGVNFVKFCQVRAGNLFQSNGVCKV